LYIYLYKTNLPSWLDIVESITELSLDKRFNLMPLGPKCFESPSVTTLPDKPKPLK
jgi:hypothetical protein